MFALIDCNNFYASCERVFRPDLNGRPVVVLSNNDGCVIARSNEAKEAGVPMGAPAYQYKQLFETQHIEVFSANFALYGDMSNRVMSILGMFCQNIEIYSIDEAFMNFNGYNLHDLEELGTKIKKQVEQWTGIPVSIGFAPTKALAKAANRIAKKFPERTKGVYLIDTEDKRIKALKWLKVEDVWGIGRRHARRLQGIGIHTAFDFCNMSEQWIKKNMSVVGVRLLKELQGIPVLEMEEVQARKSIATTRTFDGNYTDKDKIRERVASFAVSCAEKLRRQGSCCKSLMVFITTNGHRDDLPQHNQSVVIKLPFATNSSIDIVKFATAGFEQLFKKGYAYKKAGVILMDFSSEEHLQLTLFEAQNPKHRPLMKVIDKINASYGQQKIRLGAQDTGRVWKMKQEKLSPRYSTNLNEIITIKV